MVLHLGRCARTPSRRMPRLRSTLRCQQSERACDRKPHGFMDAPNAPSIGIAPYFDAYNFPI